MLGLGRLLDVGPAWAPVDLNTADAATGFRTTMRNATGCLFVANVAITGGGVIDTIFTVQQHTASTGGTSSSLVSTSVASSRGITQYWVKEGVTTTIAGSEAWARSTQAEAATVTIAGATYVAKEYMVAIHVDASQLGDTYTHVSVNVAAAALAHAKLISGIYILHDLETQRTPANLPVFLS